MLIRKTRSEILLTYLGGATYGLFAADFTVEESPALAIGLDLTCNVKVRNKSDNTYADAVSYSEGTRGSRFDPNQPVDRL